MNIRKTNDIFIRCERFDSRSCKRISTNSRRLVSDVHAYEISSYSNRVTEVCTTSVSPSMFVEGKRIWRSMWKLRLKSQESRMLVDERRRTTFERSPMEKSNAALMHRGKTCVTSHESPVHRHRGAARHGTARRVRVVGERARVHAISRAVSAATCVIRHCQADRAGALAQGRFCGVLWGQSTGPHRLASRLRESRVSASRTHGTHTQQGRPRRGSHDSHHCRAASIILLSWPLGPFYSHRVLRPDSDTTRIAKFLNGHPRIWFSPFLLFPLLSFTFLSS